VIEEKMKCAGYWRHLQGDDLRFWIEVRIYKGTI